MTRSVLQLAVLVSVSLLSGCHKEESAGHGPKEGGEKRSGAKHQGESPGERDDHGGEGHKEGEEGSGNGEHADEAGGREEVVKLAESALKNAGIETTAAVRRQLSRGLQASARISYTQKGVARVSARVSGRLAVLSVQAGDTVKEGEVLGYLESQELGEARAAYLAAVSRKRVAQSNSERESELLAKGISSAKEAREAEGLFAAAQAEAASAEARLHALGLADEEINRLKVDEHYGSRFPIRSPLGGTVVEVLGTVGQSVEPTTHLFTVGDLRQLWALLDIFEAQLSSVRKGQTATLTVNAVPDRLFTGKVEYIADFVDEKTRSIQVRVAVPNQDGALKPGMFASAEIATTVQTEADGGGHAVIIVPREALQKVEGREVVFVPKGNGVFQAIDVKVGESSAKEIEIHDGLEEGQQVVVKGAFVLKSEASKASMGEGHSH